jgi:hypothetical protein
MALNGRVFLGFCHVHGLVHAACRIDAGPSRLVLETDEVRIRKS